MNSILDFKVLFLSMIGSILLYFVFFFTEKIESFSNIHIVYILIGSIVIYIIALLEQKYERKNK